jgi:hypothetical protein
MEKQSIKLSLPKSILSELKFLALQRNLSISHLVTEAIEKMLAEETNYQEASTRQIALMKQGFDLGFYKPARRNELHKR